MSETTTNTDPYLEWSSQVMSAMEEYESTLPDPVEEHTEEQLEPETQELEDAFTDETEEGTEDTFEDQSVEQDEEQEETEGESTGLMGKTINAGGFSFTVENENDALQLMENGLRFAEMQNTIGPFESHVRTLMEHNLTDPDAFNLLIDVAKGDKAAIAKLVKDKGIDVQDLYDKGEYESAGHLDSPEVTAFANEVRNIFNKYPKSEGVLLNMAKDNQTVFETLAALPNGLNTLAQHIETGTYDEVMSYISRENVLSPSKAFTPMFTSNGLGRYPETLDLIQKAKNTKSKPQKKTKPKSSENPNRVATTHQTPHKPAPVGKDTSSPEAFAESIKKLYEAKNGAGSWER